MFKETSCDEVAVEVGCWGRHLSTADCQACLVWSLTAPKCLSPPSLPHCPQGPFPEGNSLSGHALLDLWTPMDQGRMSTCDHVRLPLLWNDE